MSGVGYRFLSFEFFLLVSYEKNTATRNPTSTPLTKAKPASPQPFPSVSSIATAKSGPGSVKTGGLGDLLPSSQELSTGERYFFIENAGAILFEKKISCDLYGGHGYLSHKYRMSFFF